MVAVNHRVVSDSFAAPCDCSLPGSSVHVISQARILEWVAISFSRCFPDPGIEAKSPALAGGFFTTDPPGKSLKNLNIHKAVNAEGVREIGSIPGSRSSSVGRYGNSLQYSCLENMDREALQATVHRVPESNMTEAT